MWVAPEARGLGIARRLLAALEDHARQSGMTSVLLDTNRSLAEAQALYRKAGYRETERYNDNPYADFFFEKNSWSGGIVQGLLRFSSGRVENGGFREPERSVHSGT